MVPDLSPMASSITLGILCIAWAVAILGRQVLTGPNAPSYPRARPIERAALFLCGALLLARAVDLLVGAAVGEPQAVGSWAVIVSAALTATGYVQLWETLRSRLPPRFWAGVEKAVELGACERWWDRKTLAEARARARGGTSHHGSPA